MDPDAYAENNKPEKGSRVGVYKCPTNGEEMWASSFPQSDALVHQGWTYDRPLPTAEEMRQADLKASRAAEAAKKDSNPSADDVKKLREQLKAEKEARKTAEAEAEQAKADAGAAMQAAEEAEKAKADAEAANKAKETN